MKKESIFLFIRKAKNIPNEIVYIFLISIFLILLIEIWLKNIEAPLKLFYIIGNITLNVCFSIIAASIFYYVNQYLPKERKIVQTARYITFRMMFFQYEIHSLQRTLKLQIKFKTEDLSSEIKYQCGRIKPNEKVTNYDESSQIFNNWHEYLLYKTSKFIKYLDDILPFNEGMNSDLFESLLNLKDSVRLLQYKLEDNFKSFENLIHLSVLLEDLFENHLRANKIIRVNYKHYLDESDKMKNIKNKIRTQEKNDIESYRNKLLDENLERINKINRK